MIYGISQYSWAIKTNQTSTGPHYLELLWDAITAKCAKLWNACFGSKSVAAPLSLERVELIQPTLKEAAAPVQAQAEVLSPKPVVDQSFHKSKLMMLQRRLDVSHVDYKRRDWLPPGSLILTRNPRTTSDRAYLEDKQYLFRDKYFFFDLDGIRHDLDFSREEDVEKLIAHQQDGGRIRVSGDQLFLY